LPKTTSILWMKESLRVIAMEDMKTGEMRFVKMDSGYKRKQKDRVDYVESFDKRMFKVHSFRTSLWFSQKELLTEQYKKWNRAKEEEFWAKKLKMPIPALRELDGEDVRFFYFYLDEEVDWFE